ncbi:MAG: hypothetical protein ACK5N0_10105, partial [Synechococcaceae cyanobacterium]
LSSLPPWRRFLAKLNWHPTIDAQIRILEFERREQESERREKELERYEQELERYEQELERREQESERRTKLIENDIARLQKENEHLAAIESKLDALLLSADSSSPIPPATDSN